MKRLAYVPTSVKCLDVELHSVVLAASIVNNSTTVSIPRGQKVDEFDFADATTFQQEWDIQPPSI